MKKTLRAMVLTATAMLLSVQAIAEGTYFGGNYTALDYELLGSDLDDFSIDMINLRLGNQFNDIFSAEMRLGFGVGDDSQDYFGSRVEASIDQLMGIYVRANLSTDTLIKPYAILGYNRIEVDYDYEFQTGVYPDFYSASYSESDTLTDVAFGIGFDFELSEELDVNLEYMSFYNDDFEDISGLTLGVAYTY